ncbi:MAG: hypothetical protein ACK5Q5_15620 [Planctomycetaceae bacterium]
MNDLRQCVDAVRIRQQRQWLWQCASVGLLLGAFAACGLGLARWLDWVDLGVWQVTGALALGPLMGAIWSLLNPRQDREAAVAIDRAYNLKDRIATALGFESKSSLATEWRQLQMTDATSHVARVEPSRVAPIHAPKSWAWGLGLTLMAVVITLLGTPPEPLVAAVVSNDVVIQQADTLSNSLEELQLFNEEDVDPEVEELLEQLAKKIEELQQPGVDPREALAKLSEMEAALQQQQQQLSDPAIDAQLQAIGNALSLSQEMQSAGEALAQGELEKAAEELVKLEMPELDRQTEKAITEQLMQLQKNDGQGAARQLQEAATQAAQGLSQGNRNRFREGMEGLAGECKKQGRRNRLSDLLRKQCQCLSECKGECESACKSPGNSNKKGGKNWGLAKSDNQPGDKTARLNSPNQMNITGQESAGGDIDVETMTAPETEQQAVRNYRDQAQKYEQLSESVLDSEPIPLGHRQTIRKYFELIRPQADTVDAVNERTSR